MTDSAAPSTVPLDLAAHALVDVGSTLSQCVAHMTAYDERMKTPAGAEAVPIPETLASIVAGTLAPVAERHGSEAVSTVADFLHEAAIVLASEIYLVAPPSRRERRSNGGRR